MSFITNQINAVRRIIFDDRLTNFLLFTRYPGYILLGMSGRDSASSLPLRQKMPGRIRKKGLVIMMKNLQCYHKCYMYMIYNNIYGTPNSQKVETLGLTVVK